MIRAVKIQKRTEADLTPFHEDIARQIEEYHRTMPGYTKTPLVALPQLSQYLGLASLYVKDESMRFHLDAFKVLGGSYAIGRLLSDRFGIPLTGFEQIREAVNAAGQVKPVFITATDGNHGRGVAYTAACLGCRCIVLLPKGTVQIRLEHIKKLGAEAEITNLTYDDAVRKAAQLAKEHGYILVQDTAWPSYEEIPLYIMQGYMTMAREADCLNMPPTHVFLQAGVGSMAAAVTAYFAAKYKSQAPRVILVEPEGADCIFRTAEQNDGNLHAVEHPESIMAGLCCGEPSPMAWKILQAYASDCISMSDEMAALGMRVLGNPLPGDTSIISGESGASTTGCLVKLMCDPACEGLRNQLNLGRDARVLCFSTEGATDPINYRRIVWDGLYPSAR